MRIISDITGKEYKTVDECLKAEEQYRLQKEAEKKAKEETEKRKDFLYNRIMSDSEEYLKLCGLSIETSNHGYKVTMHSDDKADKIFEDILNALIG